MYVPGATFTVCVPVSDWPLNESVTPAGTVMVTPVCAVKFAVTDFAAFIVTVVDAELAFATGPVQFVNVKPLFDVAVRLTTVPLSKKVPDAGVTVPPFDGDAAVVS